MSQRTNENQKQKSSRLIVGIVLGTVGIAMVGLLLYMFGLAGDPEGVDADLNNSIKAGQSSLKMSEGGQLESEDDDNRIGKREIRKRRTQQQRQELIAAISIAREARRLRDQSRLGSDSSDSEEEKAEHAKFKASIKDAIILISEDVEDCFNSALEASPDLEGTLMVQFEYEGEPNVGAVVQTAKIMKDSAGVLKDNAKLTECIIDAIYTLELPEPQAGGNTIVTYPFRLTPGDEN